MLRSRAQTMPDIVTVQKKGCCASIEEFAIYFVGDRTLARTTQTCEPYDTPLLAQSSIAFFGRNGSGVPNDVGIVAHEALRRGQRLRQRSLDPMHRAFFRLRNRSPA